MSKTFQITDTDTGKTKTIAVTPVDITEPSEPEVPELPAVPFYDVVCSQKKLSQIFTTASQTALDDFYSFFGSFARDFRIEAEVNENFFLAQVVAEVGTNLESVRENLNYSCSALQSTFSYYRERPSEANNDGRCGDHSADQVRIGDRAYANRIGNGDISSGDGYRFRGGGFFQLTGRANYQAVIDTVDKSIDYQATPEELAEIITEVGAGVLSAMAFWEMNAMYNCSNIDCCTKIINYHTDSYDKRKGYYQQIAAIPPEGN